MAALGCIEREQHVERFRQLPGFGPADHGIVSRKSSVDLHGLPNSLWLGISKTRDFSPAGLIRLFHHLSVYTFNRESEVCRMPSSSWEEAVESLRRDPARSSLVKDCYFDDPLLDAADRYRASREWAAVRRLIGAPQGLALDLGAGRGISSYALAKEGWSVEAVEPDPSALVGATAVSSLAAETGQDIKVSLGHSEDIPFGDNTFHLVHCRQMLHHSRDLFLTCNEIYRVLKPGGRLIATREHVISKPEDLDAFLSSHPLHSIYGGENAYLLGDYQQAIRRAGFVELRSISALESEINLAPLSFEDLEESVKARIALLTGRRLADGVLTHSLPSRALRWLIRVVSRNFYHAPGRLYTFVACKSTGTTA